MNLALNEHLKRLNPTGVDWADMTDAQKDELRKKWDAVVSQPKNLNCTCPRAGCRNNRNCNFCVVTHREDGSLPDCLRYVDDKISEGVPPEKRHNVHALQNPTQKIAVTRDGYERSLAEAMKNDPDPEAAAAAARMRVESWHKRVRDPEVNVCRCPRADCWYHGNCVKCIALHRYYDGFPDCCRHIFDKIDAAVQAWDKEQNL